MLKTWWAMNTRHCKNSLISRVVLGSTLSCRPSNRPTGDMNTDHMSGSELGKQHPYPLPSSQNEMKAFTITTYWLYINPGSRGQGRHKTGSSVHVHTQHNDNVDIVYTCSWYGIVSFRYCHTNGVQLTVPQQLPQLHNTQSYICNKHMAVLPWPYLHSCQQWLVVPVVHVLIWWLV